MPKTLTLKERIAVHICYRDVFNAPVSVAQLKQWLGMDANLMPHFDKSLSCLIDEGIVIKVKGFVACAGKEHLIEKQSSRSALTRSLMQKGARGLKLLSAIPFIRFVGISGSVAADNPTEASDEKHIDLDIFIVTAKNTLWCFMLLERIFTNLVKLIRGNYFYCFNYITDESFLEIYNKNFFTATELTNLKVVTDKGVYGQLMERNRWVETYYAETSVPVVSTPPKGLASILYAILGFFNYCFYLTFGVLRSLKRLDFVGIKDLTSTFDPNKRFNLHRISNSNGGYQELIKNRFDTLMQQNFESYYSADLIEKFFPSNDAFQFSPDAQIEDFEFAEQFKKYTPQVDEARTI